MKYCFDLNAYKIKVRSNSLLVVLSQHDLLNNLLYLRLWKRWDTSVHSSMTVPDSGGERSCSEVEKES